MAVRELSEYISPDTLKAHGLAPGERYWSEVLRLAGDELDDDLHHHLQSLLTADAVAGDEDLAWAETTNDLVAPPPEASAGMHTIVFAGPGTVASSLSLTGS